MSKKTKLELAKEQLKINSDFADKWIKNAHSVASENCGISPRYSNYMRLGVQPKKETDENVNLVNKLNQSYINEIQRCARSINKFINQKNK